MNQKLSDVQAGFRKGRGTKDQIGSNTGKPTLIGSYYNIHIVMMELLSCLLLYCPLFHCILTVILISWLSVALFTSLIVMILTTNHMNYPGKEEGREGRGGWREERKEGTKKERKTSRYYLIHGKGWRRKHLTGNPKDEISNAIIDFVLVFCFLPFGCMVLSSLTRKWTHSHCIASTDS